MPSKKSVKKNAKNAADLGQMEQPEKIPNELKDIPKVITDGDEIDDEDDGESSPREEQFIDISQFFNYQRAINTLIDYLNRSIDDAIAGFTRSDQLLFSHVNKKLILNAGLESGFYEFCKFRLAQIAESEAVKDQEKFLKIMNEVQGEIDLLAYLLVNTRLAHRTVTFDVFLSLLKGGLFQDILEIHSKIAKDMQERKQKLNKKNIRDTVKMDGNQFYI